MGAEMFYIIMIAMGLSLLFWAIELRQTITAIRTKTWSAPPLGLIAVKNINVGTIIQRNTAQVANIFIGIFNTIIILFYIPRLILSLSLLIWTQSREFVYDISITLGLGIVFGINGSTLLVAAAFIVSDIISIILIIYSVWFQIQRS